MQNSPDLWLTSYPVPKRDAHKYDRGHALICGGAVMTGAARLAARAAQRAGAGMVTLASPRAALAIYATAMESVIVREADTVDGWRELLDDPKRDVILIGPGLGCGVKQTGHVLAALESGKPCVVDADALTGFAGQAQALLSRLHPRCVLTPHEGEFARLFDRINANRPKTERAAEAAAIAGCTVLLKGADTVIAAPEGRLVINDNAPPWLATAGAGDVLAGIILGLVAQKMPVFEAAAAAAWMHGAAAAAFGPGLIAEDLIDGLPRIIANLSSPAP